MCEYCEHVDGEPLFHENLDDESKRTCGHLYLSCLGGLYFEIVTGCFDKSGCIEINYCPMCGKKLSAQEVEPCTTQTA